MSMLIDAYRFGGGGGGGTDPYWANVSSLLHFDGSGATLVDEKGKTWTCNGGATQSTSSPIVGTASALFGTSSSDYIYSQSSSDFAFGTGDFTIEFMMRPGSAGTQRNFLDVRTTPSGTTADRIILYHPGDNSVPVHEPREPHRFGRSTHGRFRLPYRACQGF